MKNITLCLACVLLLVTYACTDNGLPVGNAAELERAIATATPGQTIIMKDGVWSNIEILFQAQGRAGAVISLVAETPGKVIISGQSNLTLAGDYLLVSGLVFKNGYSPTGSVISFRKSTSALANHSRVTHTVIDRFNKPERFETDIWVTLYGKDNQFDHNHLVGKMNQGVTLAVRLDTEESRENHHRIEYNYFGPRPVLGSNGGETIRVGTSHFSLSDSITTIANNIFDQCDGEVEIVSIKSGANKIRGNLFLESAGTLTLRHGNGNLVEDNVFLGKGKPHTGGIRVINADHIIRNNYLADLTGTRFGAGLVVMNGVPNSPINRYHPVRNVFFSNNTLVNVDSIQLAAGSDLERSQVPLDTVLKNNLLVATKRSGDTVKVYDDISGIEIVGNTVVGMTSKIFGAPSGASVETSMAGLVVAAQAGVGARADLEVMALEQVGVSWYPKGDLRPRLDTGKVTTIFPGENSLVSAVKAAQPGDILALADGVYEVDRVLSVNRPLSLRGAIGNAGKPTIRFSRNALFEIQDGGSLKLSALVIDGAQADDSAGNSLIRTTRYGMLNNYQLILDEVDVKNLNVNHSFSVLKSAKSTLADGVRISGSQFSNISGDILRLNAETDDLGVFNADYVVIKSSTFNDVQGAIANIYRGGTDESTFGPHLIVENSRFEDVGRGNRNQSGAAFVTEGVQVIEFTANTFDHSLGLTANSDVGEPSYQLQNNNWGGFSPAITYKHSHVVVPDQKGTASE